MNEKNIFITGGCGFIGSNLTKKLIKQGSNIIIYDNYSVCSCEDYLSDYNIKLIKGDIKNKNKVLKNTKNIDAIVHLAAHSSVLESIKKPEFNIDTNIIGTFNLLEAARENNINKFIMASSNAAVGENIPPINENSPVAPLSPYGSSKLAGEGLCSAYYHSYNIKANALRFANAYGPNSIHKTSVVAKFIKRIINNKKINIYGDGKQTRDFIHVNDIVQAIILALDSNKGGEVYQVATQKETSINELVNVLKDISNKNFDVNYTNSKAGEIKKNFSDISKIKNDLNYNPKYLNLKTGLKETWDWFIKNYKGVDNN